MTNHIDDVFDQVYALVMCAKSINDEHIQKARRALHVLAQEYFDAGAREMLRQNGKQVESCSASDPVSGLACEDFHCLAASIYFDWFKQGEPEEENLLTDRIEKLPGRP